MNKVRADSLGEGQWFRFPESKKAYCVKCNADESKLHCWHIENNRLVFAPVWGYAEVVPINATITYEDAE